MRAHSSDWIIDGEETALLSHHYKICDIIEKGPICTVYRATHRNTSKTFTVRSVDLRRHVAASGLSQEDVEKEVEICAQLKHPFFCQLRDVIAGTNVVHMVFEHVDGSDICFEVVKRASSGFIYSEAVASHYVKQLTEAIRYMHSLSIVHRDIRPHNILLANKENNAPLKLRGFGIAYKLPSDSAKCPPGRIGIPPFMAPEVVSGQPYGSKADMWSIGVVLYVLLCGRLPFSGPQEHIFECITEGKYSLMDSSWAKVSDSAKDLVTRLLTVDENERISAEQCLAHSWIADRSLPARTHLSETVENIRRYNQRRQLKSNIILALNSPKWNRFPVNSFLSADSMPGGDACDSDCRRRGPHGISGEDMTGLEKVLTSLDQIAALYNYSLNDPDPTSWAQLERALEDKTFHELLALYDRIRNHDVRPSAINHGSGQTLTSVKNEIEGLLSPSNEATELAALLNNVHLQAILQAEDIVIEEVLSPSQLLEKGEIVTAEVTPIANCVSPQSTCSAAEVASTSTSPDQVTVAQRPQQLVSATKSLPVANGSIRFAPQTSAHTTLGQAHTVPEGCNSVPGTSSAVSRIDGPIFSDDDDLMLNAISRIRLVQFQKDTEEPMGITLKITEDGRCLVARIMHGGLIHRQATLHVNDEIREINGINVANQSVETLQRMLRDARGSVTFKIIPSYRSAPPACEIFVRAQFDYDPTQDDLIPCPQAGVPFNTGDIIQVISKDDHNWWQARYIAKFPALGGVTQTINPSAASSTLPSSVSGNVMNNLGSPPGSSGSLPPKATILISPTTGKPTGSVAGLIPSPELQEWRTACLAMEKAKDNSTCLWFNKKKKYYTTKYLRKHSDIFDQLDLVTYEEVERCIFRRKTLVLLGAHGVGRRHIKNTLIHRHPQRFAYPIPRNSGTRVFTWVTLHLDTTRPPRKDEIDGKHYYFVSNDAMMADIQSNEYLEYGTHEECMYGTKLETIRAIHRTNKMAILDVEPQALKVLRTAEYAPFVVFIAAPNLQGLQDPDGSLERLVKESDMMRQAFGHLFDYVIVNNDIDETIKELEMVVEKLSAILQWVPVSWVY
ncbi:peripheral plasma membrane protein CASK-like isoform 1 [Aphelenchoides avenae]|nr:peripheral plasma membrane protein CASK-like isoform 1 [Aphelenchus avenae]